MNRTWKFTEVEFYVLWDELKEGILPAPFWFTTDIDSAIEFDMLKTRAMDQLRLTLDRRAFREVLDAMLNPDLRIVLNGWDERPKSPPDRVVRMLAVRRGENGYVITARPGRTFLQSGGYEVIECSAVQLAETLVAAMPEVEAGRLSDIVLPARTQTEEMDYSFGASAVHDSFDDSVNERAQRFLQSETLRVGTIEIIQGHSIYGPRGVTQHLLEWRELVDDGRYVIDDQHPPTAFPADHKRLITMINARIAAVVRAIKDERA
jgi:hypothetical protein